MVNEFTLRIIQFAAAGLQLQQQYPFESIQNVKQSLCIKFGENKCIIFQVIQFISFTSLISENSAAFDTIILIFILNGEKPMSYKEKIQAV